jgi:hypothetical protein
VLAAARGGRQLPRPEQLNVARRTLACHYEGGTVARGRSSTCSLTTAARLSANRIAAPLGERRKALDQASYDLNVG